MQPREQRERLVAGGAVICPTTCADVVRLGLLDVLQAVGRVGAVTGLDEQRDDRRVPPAVVHEAALRPRVRGRMVDAGVAQSLELDEAVLCAGHVRLGVVMRATRHEHVAVGEEQLVRAEQCVERDAGVVERLLQRGRRVRRDRDEVLRRVLLGVRTTSAGKRGRPGRRRTGQVEQPGLVLNRLVAELASRAEVDVFHAFQAVPIEDLSVCQYDGRHRCGLARHTVDHGVAGTLGLVRAVGSGRCERRTEAADDAGVGGHGVDAAVRETR